MFSWYHVKGYRNRLALICVILFAVMLAGCGNASEEELSPIVQIAAGEITGSGVVYLNNEENMIIVTAAHVLQSAKDSVEVIFEDGSVVESNDYVISNTSDIAFVVVGG